MRSIALTFVAAILVHGGVLAAACGGEDASTREAGAGTPAAGAPTAADGGLAPAGPVRRTATPPLLRRTPGPGQQPSSSSGGAPAYVCSLVIGHSQTNQWFQVSGTFEPAVGDANWQLLWQNGATVNLWSRDRFEGWQNPVQSPCSQGSDSPDRVVFQVGAFPGATEDDIVAALRRTIANIRARYPWVREIVLFPTLTGPDRQPCYIGGELVAASQSHLVVAPAIDKVTGAGVVGGFTPEVRSCADYADSTGHLTRDGAAAAGTLIASYFNSR